MKECGDRCSRHTCVCPETLCNLVKFEPGSGKQAYYEFSVLMPHSCKPANGWARLWQ